MKMRSVTTILCFLSLISLLGSCGKAREEYPDFFDPAHRAGLWIAPVGPVKKDTLQFIDSTSLIRKGDFYVHEEYLYRIEGDNLFIRLPDESHETQHKILATDQNSVLLGNMFMSIGFQGGSGMYFKVSEN